MKKWLDKTWAKATAFCLLIAFTVLLTAGIVGIVFLVTEDVYLDGGKRLQEDRYQNYIYREISSVCYYLSDNLTEGRDLNDPALAEDFAQMFANSSCELTVVDKTGKLNNYELIVESPGEDTETFTFADDRTVTVTARLDPDRVKLTYEDILINRLIRWRYGIIALTAVCLICWLISLIFTVSSAGHWHGYEGIHLTWLDRIPADLWLAAFLICIYLLVDSDSDLSIAITVLLVLLFYFFLPAFAAQCKADVVIKNSLTARLCRGILKVFGRIGRALAAIPLVWKTSLCVLLLLAFDCLCIANYWDTEFLVVMLIVNAAVGLFLIYTAAGLRKLQKGGRDLAAGNYDSHIDTGRLFGDFRRHGENLNAIQQGMQRAVEQQMRSERMKTELITNVSHDIKTPLTSIVNYVDLLKKEKIDNPTAREYIEADWSSIFPTIPPSARGRRSACARFRTSPPRSGSRCATDIRPRRSTRRSSVRAF